MSASTPPEASRAFANLADVVYGGGGAADILEVIVATTSLVVPAADHVCVTTLRRDGTLETRAASDDVARLMDRLESEADEGPCIDSIEMDSFQLDSDIAGSSRWPRLARLVLERTPVRGMVGYQLMGESRSRCALNIFSDTPGGLTEEAADNGAVLAAFTSVALAAAEQRETAENLRRGLESNREIGKAVGLLMAAHSISDDEAFELLRQASSRTNTRLAEVARRIALSQRS
jgi:hypothetical protein